VCGIAQSMFQTDKFSVQWIASAPNHRSGQLQGICGS
jgi:hypothetical protein